MEKVLIGEMSWTDFRDAIKATELVIIPVGALKAHGGHNPLGTDTLIAEACAARIGAGAGVPVAPVLPFGYAPGDVGFAGTVSLDPHLYRKLIVSYAASYVTHGVKRFLFINGHGGNNDILAMVCADLYDRHGCICSFTHWRDILPELNSAWPCDDGEGLFETSMLLAVNDALVEGDKARRAPVDDLTPEITPCTAGWKYKGAVIPMAVDLAARQKTADGAQPPAQADQALGLQMLEAYITYNVGLVHELIKIKQ